MHRRMRTWPRAVLVALMVATVTVAEAPAARAAGDHPATLTGGGSTSQADEGEGPLCSPDIGWSISTPSPGGGRAVIQINYRGSVDCNFYLAGVGQSYLWDRTNGTPNKDSIVSRGNLFSFGQGTGGTSSGSIPVDGRVDPGLRKAEVGFALALRTLDGTPWGPCGQLPYPWHYVSECAGVGTNTLSVTIGSGVFDTGLAPYASLPVPRDKLDRSYYAAPHHNYPAIDLPVGRGTPVYAVKGGTISYTSSDTGKCGVGVYIRADDVYYLYCHFRSRSVASGAQVLAGDQIGESGDTGSAAGHPHLHFEIRTGRGTGTRYCPQDMLLSIYDTGTALQPPQYLPTTGCFYQTNTKVSLNKTSFQVGEVPVYSVTGTQPNSPIYWSSSRNGVPVEDEAFYGQYTDANGNWSGSGNAWASTDAGSWTKTIHVDGGEDTFAFTVTAGSEVKAPKNLAVNGGFNHGFGSWQVMPQTNAVTYGPGVTGNDPYEGTQFAATNTSDGNGGIYQDVPVSIKPGDTFCGSAQVATQGSGSGASGTFVIWLLDGPGGSEPSSKYFANLPGGNAWTQVQACVTATREHPAIRIQFYPTANNGQTLLIDNVDVH